jgi:benzaldehyde dehydrogenase (NAD)
VDAAVTAAAAAQPCRAAQPYRGQRFAERCNSGMVHVNDSTSLDEAHAPFGGVGASGLGGRAGGDANLAEFTEMRWISVQRDRVEYPY